MSLIYTPISADRLRDPDKAPDITPTELPIRLYGIVRESIVDGPGLRFVVFVQGCPHHCPSCHNPESHGPDGGFLTTTTRIWQNLIGNPTIRGVTFSGGEPFLWAKELAAIGRCANAVGMDVMTYSGWTYEKLLAKAETEPDVRSLLDVTHYLVDGPFVAAERDLSLRFRGSRNQHIRDLTEGGKILDGQWDDPTRK